MPYFLRRGVSKIQPIVFSSESDESDSEGIALRESALSPKSLRAPGTSDDSESGRVQMPLTRGASTCENSTPIVFSSDSDESDSEEIGLGESALSPKSLRAAGTSDDSESDRVQMPLMRGESTGHFKHFVAADSSADESDNGEAGILLGEAALSPRPSTASASDGTYIESSTSSFDHEMKKRQRLQKSSSSSSSDNEEQNEGIKQVKNWKKSRVSHPRIRVFPPQPSLSTQNKRRMINFDELEPSERNRALEVHLKMLVYKRMGMLVKSQFEHWGGVTQVIRLYEGLHGAPPPHRPDGCNKVVLRRDGHEGNPWRVLYIRMPYKLSVPDPPREFSSPSAPEFVDWLRYLRILLRSHQVRMCAIKKLEKSSLFSKPDEQFSQVGSVEVNMTFEIPVEAERLIHKSVYKYGLQMIFSGGPKVLPDTVNVFNQEKKIAQLTDVLMKIALEYSMFNPDCKLLLPQPLQPPLVDLVEKWHKVLILVTTQAEEDLEDDILLKI